MRRLRLIEKLCRRSAGYLVVGRSKPFFLVDLMQGTWVHAFCKQSSRQPVCFKIFVCRDGNQIGDADCKNLP